MRGCVIIPAYNEEMTIGPVVREIRAKGLDCVVVNDGSSDKTRQVAEHEGAYVISHPKNYGKGTSLTDGFRYSLNRNYNYIITMDGDGQHNPDEIDNFLKVAEKGDTQIVLGNRMCNPKDMPLIRRLTNRFMSLFISSIVHQKLPDSQCGFRLIKSEVLKVIACTATKYEIESEVIIRAARAGFKIKSIPIRSIYKGEKSQIRPVADTLRFIAFILKTGLK
ncbi:MAG: glycosyltransferase family 2 protein [Candidatus Omnitrophota bacterium]